MVAVKVIKSGVDSRHVLARFEAERQALAMMDHPNIAKVLDAGTTESGRPFFVLELVKGTPITKFCDERRLSPHERLALFVPVCNAIQHAHQKGVIHRDLKPSNVLVALYDDRPVPKVIDFGVAKATGPQLTERTMFTGFGAVVGTPEYMSPEQASFNQVDVDTRSDVYALGVLLYELLTGSTPVDRKSLGQAAVMEVLRIVREVEAPRPSQKLSSSDALPSIAANRHTEPSKLAQMMRGELDWVVMKALEKDRSRRYETANGLARDVQRYLADEVVEARPPSAGYRLRKFVRRNKGRVVAAALVLFALVGGVVGTALGLVEARRQEAKAVAERDEKEQARAAEEDQRSRAERAADAERQAREQAQRRLAQVEKANEILGSVFKDLNPRAEEKEGKPLQALLGERLDHATAQLEGDTIGDPLAVARMQQTLGISHLGLGYPEKAISLFSKARATFTDRLGPGDPDTLASTFNLAQSYRYAGRLDSALSLGEQAYQLAKSKLGRDHALTLACSDELAQSFQDAGKIDRALPLYEECLELKRAKFGPGRRETLSGLNNLAEGYRSAGKFASAVPLYQEALRLQKANLGPDHPDTITTMNNLAGCYMLLRKTDMAVSLGEETLRLSRARLGSDHPLTLSCMGNLAAFYRSAGAVDQGLALQEETLRLMRTKLGPDHPNTLVSMNNLASDYRAVGRLDRALPLFEDAAHGMQARNFQHVHARRIVPNTIACLEAMNLFERAEAWRRKWLPVVKNGAGAASPAYMTQLAGLGTNLMMQGKWADAEPVLRECLAIREKQEPDAWTTSNTKSALGGSLLGQKKYAEAEPLLLAGYEGMKQRADKIPANGKARLPEAASRLVGLCAATGRPAEAARWLDETWAWAETTPDAKP